MAGLTAIVVYLGTATRASFKRHQHHRPSRRRGFEPVMKNEREVYCAENALKKGASGTSL
jgi:hypothetical protein